MYIEFTSADYVERLEAENAKLKAERDALKAEKDGAYTERNQVVAALAKAFPSGVARTTIEGWDPEWHGCVFIDLPTGQASWHFHDSHASLFADLPTYAKPWDGHSTPEKYDRLARMKPICLESENAKLRDLLRGEAAVAEECAKIVEEPSGQYSVGHRRLPYWDGEAKAAEIRKRFGGKA